MGFHFGTESEVGEAQSKSPTCSRDRYNYHDFLYSMSGKDTFQYKQHQRGSASNLARPAVPPRTSSLPVLDSSSSNHETMKDSSERNSKAIMRALLPADLRLAGTNFGYDFSSWNESTIQELQRSGNYEKLRRKSRDLSTAEVPWMQEDQDPTLAGVRSRKCGEMSVYADPLSAIVSHPYRNGLGETSFHRLSRSADWESANAPAPPFSKPCSEQSQRCSGSTLVDESDKQLNSGRRDTFRMQRTISSGSKNSDHSFRSQEERASKAVWLKPLPSVPVIGSIISPTVFSPTQSDACALTAGHSLTAPPKISSGADVAPAQSASHSRKISDASFVSAVSSLNFPVLEPLMIHDLARTASPVSSMDTPLEPRAMGKGRRLHQSITASPSATTPVSGTADLISPLWGLSNHTLAQHASNERSADRQGNLSSMAISGILADITSSIAEFPVRLLCLDTPCIVAIRHDMHAAKTIKSACTSATSSPASPVSPSSAYARRNAEPKIQLSASVIRKLPVRRRRTGHIGDMLRSPLPASLRAGSPPPPPPAFERSRSSEETVTLRTDRYSPAMDRLSHYRNDLYTDLSHLPHPEQDQSIASQELKCPDLSAIASIFPESDGWWQSCLLAHLLAHNYLKKLNSALSAGPVGRERGGGRTVPDKAGRVMGIPENSMLGKEETMYTKVLEDLEKCMIRIMKSMMGKREGVLGMSSPEGAVGKGELALVRALSVVVGGMDV